MLSKDEYERALALAQSYMNVDPQPGSRYYERLRELMQAIGEYERNTSQWSGRARCAGNLNRRASTNDDHR